VIKGLPLENFPGPCLLQRKHGARGREFRCIDPTPGCLKHSFTVGFRCARDVR
jgi:hypothetical protein